MKFPSSFAGLRIYAILIHSKCNFTVVILIIELSHVLMQAPSLMDSESCIQIFSVGEALIANDFTNLLLLDVCPNFY